MNTCSIGTSLVGLSTVPFASLILVSSIAKIPDSNSFLHSITTPTRTLPTVLLPGSEFKPKLHIKLTFSKKEGKGGGERGWVLD